MISFSRSHDRLHKSIPLFSAALIGSLAALCLAADSRWIGDQAPAPTRFQLLESSNSRIVFDMAIPGLWITPSDSGVVLISGDSPDHPSHEYGSIPTVTTLVAVPRNSRVTAILESRDSQPLEMPLPPYGVGGNQRGVNSLAPCQPEIGRAATMRGVTVVPVTVPLVLTDNREFRRVTHARVRLDIAGGTNARPASKFRTEAFQELWGDLILNSREILDPELPIPGTYLIVVPDILASLLTPLVQWKQRSGHPVHVATLTETGTTTAAIHDYISNAYHTWDNPPEYVLLVGDVSGNYTIPTFYIPGTLNPLDCTDLPYTLIDGSDYFPEMLIGRLSVSSGTDLSVIVNKILSYERSPSMTGNNWFERGLVVANATVFPPYQVMTSSRLTKLWCREQMLGYGFENVDTVFYPAQMSPQLVSDAINQGVSFVNYRGYGTPTGWGGPDFSINEVNTQLNNIHKLPVVTSIVCGGGNFAYDFGPCFGEAWLRVGTSGSPRGAVAFIGPSEGDTKTWFNNCIDAGIYWGIFHDELPTLGQVLLRGKMEAYLQFPFYHEPGNSHNSVHFYFHVYSILGDPGLRLWTARPTELTVEHPSELAAGTNNISVSVTSGGSSVSGVRVAIATLDTLLAVANTGDDGIAHLVFTPIEGDSAWLTVTGRNRLPYLATLLVSQLPAYVTLESFSLDDDNVSPSQGNGDGIPNPGERVEITVTARNTGSQSASDVNAVLRGVGVLDSTMSFGTIAPGGTATGSGPFLFDVPIQSRDGETIANTILFRSSPSEWQSVLSLNIGAPAPLFVSSRALDGGNGSLDPGEESDVTMMFANAGSAPTGSATLTISSLDAFLEVIDSVAIVPSIDAGDSIEFSGNIFTMHASNTILPAEPASIMYQWLADNGWADSGTVTMTLGEVGSGDPTAPDFYGYRAYDNGDTTYAMSPTYHWAELNPALGGSGEDTGLRDPAEGSDVSTTVDLPFQFSYYGQNYDQITICSNGWICMGQTSMVTQNNYGIPFPMSPPALIAGFWDDLKMLTDSYILTYHDVLSHCFTIEYYFMENVVNDAEETFQIILYDPQSYSTPTGDGIIEFQYQAVHDVDQDYCYATVGIQCPDPREGLQYSYFHALAPGADSLVAGRAIRFAPGGTFSGPYVRATGFRIDDDDVGGSSGNGNGLVNNGEVIELFAKLQNFGSPEAIGLSAILRSANTYAAVLDSAAEFGTLAPQDTLWNTVPFRFSVRGDVPHDYWIPFNLEVQDEQGHAWFTPFGFDAYSPLIGLGSVEFDDDDMGQSHGNNNGEINPGETIELSAQVRNTGGNQAVDVQAILRTTDPMVTLVDSVGDLGTILPEDSMSSGFDFVATVSATAPDSGVIAFDLYCEDSTGAHFSLPFVLLVKDFQVLYHHKSLSDAPPGNNNGYADPGETLEVTIALYNPDQGTATGISATIATSDSEFVVEGGTLSFPILPGNSQVSALSTFSITVDDSCPSPHRGVFYIDISADEGYAITDSFHLTAGKFELLCDFDGDFPMWTHGGIEDKWDTTGIDFMSFRKSLYCGDETTLLYPNSSNEMAFSPQFDLAQDLTLVFDQKYDFADTDYGRIVVSTNSGTIELARFEGSSGGWVRQEISFSSLTPTSGTRMFFGIMTNPVGAAQGWWIDNVMILRDYQSSFVADPVDPAPQTYHLDSAYPNPFNTATVIPYGVPERAHVAIEVYNILGQRVAVLENADRMPGNYKVLWNAVREGSGIYLVRMEAGAFSKVLKIVLLK